MIPAQIRQIVEVIEGHLWNEGGGVAEVERQDARVLER